MFRWHKREIVPPYGGSDDSNDPCPLSCILIPAFGTSLAPLVENHSLHLNLTAQVAKTDAGPLACSHPALDTSQE